MAERQDAGKAPHQIDREGQDGVTEILADQRNGETRNMHGAGRRGQQVQGREQRGAAEDAAECDGGGAVQAPHASTTRPLSGNEPPRAGAG